MSVKRESPIKILIADDQDDILTAARLLLKGEGIRADTTTRPEGVLEKLKSESYDVVIIDLNYTKDTTSGAEGLDLLKHITEKQPGLPVIVMTAWATINLAVEAMRQGAQDFVTKPWDNERMLHAIRTQTELYRSRQRELRLEGENRILRNQQQNKLIGESPPVKEMMDTISRVAPSDACILITGENGTGKSMIARIIHDLSSRGEFPFISVNMGGLPEALFESELFGHVKGAFTDAKSDRMGRYELADTGTLFLDEIGNLPENQQTSLLRLLETGEFERVGSSKTRKADARIISATNANLEEKVANATFRQDLYFRLNTVTIEIPPLRERGEDILLLAESFLERYKEKYRKPLSSFSSKAKDLLLSYEWPGNVRELDHAVEKAVLLSEEGEVQPSRLGLSNAKTGSYSLDEMSLDDVEKYYIQRALKRYGGNATDAAKALGLSRSAFYRRLQRHDL